MSFRLNNNQEIYHYPYGSQANYSHQHNSYDGNSLCNEESNFWSSNSPRSDTPSPTVAIGRHPYHTYSALSFASAEICQSQYRSGCALGSIGETDSGTDIPVPYVRVVKRRTTANKKERRRTQSINNAYADLRDCIPNVPSDTKLSKIKTLRLATSYISYLTAVLETDEPAGAFKVELNTNARRGAPISIEGNDHPDNLTDFITMDGVVSNSRRSKGRTGWPQHVWALELKQEQAH